MVITILDSVDYSSAPRVELIRSLVSFVARRKRLKGQETVSMNRRLPWMIGACSLLLAGALDINPVWAEGVDAPDTSGVEITGEYGPHFPPNIAKHPYAQQIDNLIDVVHVFMAALFVAWGIFFVYCLVRFRQRAGHKAMAVPVKAKISKYVEVAVAVFEVFLLLGLSIPAWGAVKNDLPAESENPLHIRVIAEQFAWNFHYPGVDGVFGKTTPTAMDLATNPVGIIPSDPHGEDDVVIGQMHIPVDRRVIAEISSKDVIHSFSIPVLRVKQDVIPGMRIPVWFEVRSDAVGNYEIACAQLCGNNHYSMKALMVVHSPADYEAWFEKASAPPEEFDEDELD